MPKSRQLIAQQHMGSDWHMVIQLTVCDTSLSWMGYKVQLRMYALKVVLVTQVCFCAKRCVNDFANQLVVALAGTGEKSTHGDRQCNWAVHLTSCEKSSGDHTSKDVASQNGCFEMMSRHAGCKCPSTQDQPVCINETQCSKRAWNMLDPFQAPWQEHLKAAYTGLWDWRSWDATMPKPFLGNTTLPSSSNTLFA